VDVDAAQRLIDELRPHVPDERVLGAIAGVDRARFVPPQLRHRAWENTPLPIGEGQTISQPLVVARMLALLELESDDRVLDVGTGSGWHAALLARLAEHVWSVELHRTLTERARKALAAAGIENVTVRCGDGRHGLPEAAPFDAINVAAAAESAVPTALQEQLGPGGRLVAPVGGEDQRLVVLRRTSAGVEAVALEPVRFVPLVDAR
jgi:protein-L-isoaspartate(D-aspartate) O-methyltransferase